MRRRLARPYGQSITGVRLISGLMAIMVLGMLYSRMRDPATWRAFADDDTHPSKQIEVAQEPASEIIIPGPNDLEEDEVAAAQDDFELVFDRSPLKTRDMDAYWRLLAWSRTQSFAELDARAKHDIFFTQLWDQPKRYRGKPISLRLHIRRVVVHDELAPNSSNVNVLYEASGATDESKSHPYIVLFPDAPAGLPVGAEVRAEIEFVGYFLKIMSYTAVDKPRGAPLLIGRARLIPSVAQTAPEKTDPWTIGIVTVMGLVFIGFAVWTGRNSRIKTRSRILPDEVAAIGSLAPFGESFSFDQLDQQLAASATLASDIPNTEKQEPTPSV